MVPSRRLYSLAACAALLAASPAFADWLKLNDGTTIENCFIRDEGVRLVVWEDMKDVGTSNYRVVPRHMLSPVPQPFKIERDAAVWDAKPSLPDLTVTFIEITPKLPGLHNMIQYDDLGRPTIGGSPLFKDVGDDAYLHPEKVVEGIDFQYKPGQKLTLTAHVKNIGFMTAKPFEYVWMIDDEVVKRGKCAASLKEMEETTFELPYVWKTGQHYVTFKIETEQDEIAVINNVAKDALWAYSFTYGVSKGRVNAWHDFRSGYGTFSFEDYYRWHLDVMNLLMEKSIFPSAPNGIIARVRLDRIIYGDTVENNTPVVDGKPVTVVGKGGLRYDQGGWYWNDSPEELKTGQFIQVNPEWRNSTEWSLPHELGHQLGLVDWYNLDYPGSERHLMPDTGEKIERMSRYPITMMHWHGPNVFSEVDAGYFNATWDKPRGYFGDLYFDMPAVCYLQVVDVNGQPVPDAKVEIFQRGAKVDPDGKPQTDAGVTYYPVVEDGDFYSENVQKLTATPVVEGATDADGMLRLPNRPTAKVVTLNGYHRKDNPFGNLNVVGQRLLMLAKVTKNDRPSYYFLDGHEFCTAYLRGFKDKWVITLRTPYASVDSPDPPQDVRVEKIDDTHVKVTWSKPAIDDYNYTYLTAPIGYKVYYRFGNTALNDKPWCPMASVDAQTFETVIDLSQVPQEIRWGLTRHRFAVSTLALTEVESELAEVVLPK